MFVKSMGCSVCSAANCCVSDGELKFFNLSGSPLSSCHVSRPALDDS